MPQERGVAGESWVKAARRFFVDLAVGCQHVRRVWQFQMHELECRLATSRADLVEEFIEAVLLGAKVVRLQFHHHRTRGDPQQIQFEYGGEQVSALLNALSVGTVIL